jgi:hypothetical protein
MGFCYWSIRVVKKRWRETKTGRFLTFPAVVDRVKAMAEEIAAAGSDAPQPKIAALDVSTAASGQRQGGPKAKRRRAALTDVGRPRAAPRARS